MGTLPDRPAMSSGVWLPDFLYLLANSDMRHRIQQEMTRVQLLGPIL